MTTTYVDIRLLQDSAYRYKDYLANTILRVPLAVAERALLYRKARSYVGSIEPTNLADYDKYPVADPPVSPEPNPPPIPPADFGLTKLQDDPSPTLGGDLVLNGFSILDDSTLNLALLYATSKI